VSCQHRQLIRFQVKKFAVHLLVRLRQRDPELNAGERCRSAGLPAFVQNGQCPDLPSSIDRPGRIIWTVPRESRMENLPFEQIGHGAETDVRMRPNIQPLLRRQAYWPHLVQEYERPDHPALNCRQARRTGIPAISLALALMTRIVSMFRTVTVPTPYP
jgi:hypothetical protein